MEEDTVRKDFLTSVSQSVSTGFAVLFAGAIGCIICVPYYIFRDEIPDWVHLWFGPRSALILLVVVVFLAYYIGKQISNKIWK